MVQLQFLALLSLVPSIDKSNSFLASFLQNLRLVARGEMTDGGLGADLRYIFAFLPGYGTSNPALIPFPRLINAAPLSRAQVG